MIFRIPGESGLAGSESRFPSIIDIESELLDSTGCPAAVDSQKINGGVQSVTSKCIQKSENLLALIVKNACSYFCVKPQSHEQVVCCKMF